MNYYQNECVQTMGTYNLPFYIFPAFGVQGNKVELAYNNFLQ